MRIQGDHSVRATAQGFNGRRTARQSLFRLAVITEDESLGDLISAALQPLEIRSRRFLTPWHWEQSCSEGTSDVLILDQFQELQPADPFLAKCLQLPWQPKVILLADSPATRGVVLAMKAGVESVLERTASGDCLRAGIVRAIDPGGTIAGWAVDAHAGGATGSLQVLTAQQQRVAELVYLGNSNRQIAATLAIAVKTVESHRSQIMSRLKLRSVAELIRLMAREKTA
jgi:DNA-binding NarL/FixJ family response regulator